MYVGTKTKVEKNVEKENDSGKLNKKKMSSISFLFQIISNC